MREHDDRRGRVERLQIVLEPSQLCAPDHGHRIGNVVERDEVNAFVVERVVQVAEELAVNDAGVGCGVVLARHELDHLQL